MAKGGARRSLLVPADVWNEMASASMQRELRREAREHRVRIAEAELLLGTGDEQRSVAAGTPEEGPASDEGAGAEAWPCRPCGLLLGWAHVTVGAALVFYDVATNSASETAFAIVAGLCYMWAGALALVACRRRADRPTLSLFAVFAAVGLLLSLVMFAESAQQASRACRDYLAAGGADHLVPSTTTAAVSWPPALRMCGGHRAAAHSALMAAALVEIALCSVSIIVAARSLRRPHQTGPPHPSPFAALALDVGAARKEKPADKYPLIDVQTPESESGRRPLGVAAGAAETRRDVTLVQQGGTERGLWHFLKRDAGAQ